MDFVFNFLPDDLDDGFEFGAVEAFAPVEVDGEADAGDGVAFFIAVEGVLVPVGVGDFEVVFLEAGDPLFPFFRVECEAAGDEFAELDAKVLFDLAIHFSEGEGLEGDRGKNGEVDAHTVRDIDPDEPANIISFLALEWTQAAPQSARLNDVASENI